MKPAQMKSSNDILSAISDGACEIALLATSFRGIGLAVSQEDDDAVSKDLGVAVVELSRRLAAIVEDIEESVGSLRKANELSSSKQGVQS